MESLYGGGIGRHLTATYDAVKGWLEFETPIQKTSGIGDDLLLSLAMEDVRKEVPEFQPEALRLLRESRRFGVPAFPGSINEWPWIGKQELNRAIDAELDYQEIVAANLRLMAERQEQNNG